MPLRLAGALGALLVSASCVSSAGAIAGGRSIPVRAAPWTVFILEIAGPTHFVCTGSVLDPTHIVTAAHCVLDEKNKPASPSAFVVKAGISDFAAPHRTDLEQDRKVSRYRVHPRYVYTGADDPDDVSVLELDAPLDLSGPAVKAVTLPDPTKPFPAGATATLAGFGARAAGERSKGPLGSLTAKVDPQGACGRSVNGPLEFNAIELCASSPTSSVCNGDSGGGLVTAGSTPTLVGIVSAGAPGCDIGSRSLFTYTGAPEILSFIRGNDHPATAPREGANPADIRWPGPLVVGNTVTCDHGDWPGTNARYTYSFVTATGKVLQHGSKPSFAIRAGEKGASIRCEVTASNAGGTSIDETAPSPQVLGVPHVRIVRVAPLSGARGHPISVRVTLASPGGLFGRFAVCISPPRPVAGRLCHTTLNPRGKAGAVPFDFRFRVKPTARRGTNRMEISAVAGLSTATASASLLVS
jgi:hypothetical protein